MTQGIETRAPNYSTKRGTLKEMPAVWDLSKGPTKNDRALKVGSGDQTHWIGICGIDRITRNLILADGYTLAGSLVSRRAQEPDSIVLRLHAAEGKGPDGFWVPRIMVDDTNESKKRTNRGMMVIDQCGSQNWGFLNDQFKVRRVGKGTVCDDEELRFNAAGFLTGT